MDDERERATALCGLSRRGLLTAVAGGVTVGSFGSLPVAGREGTVTVLHDTHFHGRFEAAGEPSKDIVAYDAIVSEFRAAHDGTVFLGNGDDLAPSVLGLEYEGEHMVEALNEMGVDAVGVGNHEFDFGAETATDRFADSEFPWVAANLLTPDGDPVPGAERWTTVEAGDHTVGVFGLGSEGFENITDYPDDWQVLDVVEAAREAVNALRGAGADLVVLASHVSSGTHERLANDIEGLDAIVGSHSDVLYETPREVSGTVVAEFGDEFDHLGRLTLDAETGDLREWERVNFYDGEALEDGEDPPGDRRAEHTAVDVSGVEGDDELRALVDGYLAELEERLGEPVVESEVPLDATFDNYARETAFGNLLTDLMREVGDLEAGVDVAVQNAGGIRSDTVYGPGEVTGRDVMNILPFPNEIEVYEVSGADLAAYLEESVRPMPGDFGAQPAIQVSGLSYEWRGHFGESEVFNVLVDGEPLDPDDEYLVATNDFVAGRSVLGDGELVLASGQFQGPYIKERLEEEFDTVAPEREHRIVRVDERVDQQGFDLTDETATVTLEEPAGSDGVAPETFRAITPEGEAVAANGAAETEADGEAAVEVTFDREPLLSAAGGDTEPRLRLLGGFEPDEEHYGYDLEESELPVSSGYDRFQLRAELDAAAMLAAAGEATGTDSGPTTAREDTDASTSTGDGAGLGPLAALAGAGIGTGAYAARRDDGT